MAISGKLKWDIGPITGGSGKGSAELHYWLYSDDPANDDREDALIWLRDNAPATVMDLTGDMVHVTKLIKDNLVENEAIWDGKATYTSVSTKSKPPLTPTDPPDDPQPVRWSIRSGAGETLTRTGSRAFIEGRNYESAPGDNTWYWDTDTNVRNLLNLKADAKEEGAAMFTAQGIPVSMGTVEIQVETLASANVINAGFLVTAALMAGKNVTNDAIWNGFPVESLRLTAFNASQRSGDEAATALNTEFWDIDYTFAYSPEIAAADIVKPPGMSTVVPFISVKKGWHYLDVVYENDYHEILGTGGVKVVLPQAKRQSIQRIYETADFSLLRI